MTMTDEYNDEMGEAIALSDECAKALDVSVSVYAGAMTVSVQHTFNALVESGRMDMDEATILLFTIAGGTRLLVDFYKAQAERDWSDLTD